MGGLGERRQRARLNSICVKGSEPIYRTPPVPRTTWAAQHSHVDTRVVPYGGCLGGHDLIVRDR